MAFPLSAATFRTGFTLGSLLFVNVTGDIAQDNTSLFYDDTNKVLVVGGIGTTAAINLKEGSTAAVSAANTGRLRYNEGTQKFQVSLNGAAYVDVATGTPGIAIGDTISGATAGSVLFAGVAGVLAQDNANFFWDDGANRLGIGNAAPAQALHVTGTGRFSAGLIVDALTLGSVPFVGASGAIAQDNASFFWDATNKRLGIGNAAPDVALDLSTGISECAIQMGTGGSVGVSDANTGRLKYTVATQKFQVSANGAAYADLATGSGMAIGNTVVGSTTTRVLFNTGTLLADSDFFKFSPTDANRGKMYLGSPGAVTGNYNIISKGSTGSSMTGGYAAQAGNNTLYTGFDCYDTLDAKQAMWGWGESASGGVFASRAYLLSNTEIVMGLPLDAAGSVKFTFHTSLGNLNIGATQTNPAIKLRIEAASATAGIQIGDGATLPVSAASTGRFRYVSATQVWQMSKNGSTYESVASLATAQTYTASQNVAAVALTDAANIATNAALGNVFTVTLGGNRTLDNPTNLVSGGRYTWIVTQDGAGTRTLAYGAAFKWPAGAAPVLSVGAAAIDKIEATYNGTVLLATFNLGFA